MQRGLHWGRPRFRFRCRSAMACLWGCSSRVPLARTRACFERRLWRIGFLTVSSSQGGLPQAAPRFHRRSTGSIPLGMTADKAAGEARTLVNALAASDSFAPVVTPAENTVDL